MPAPIENDNARRYKTPEERQEMFASLCAHVFKGFSLKSFVECGENTITRYREEYPEDCPQSQLDEAYRGCRFFWEEIGIEGTVGRIKGFNPKSWEFNIKNRFPEEWQDKQTVDHSGNLNLSNMSDEQLDAQIKAMAALPGILDESRTKNSDSSVDDGEAAQD